MKVIINHQHIKTVPKRYKPICNDKSLYTDLTRKRLNKSERFNLEVAILLHNLPLIAERTSKEKIESVAEVTVKQNPDYHVAIFKTDTGRLKVKCPLTLAEFYPGEIQNLKRMY